jgi:Cu2+-exporting ATPase
MHCGLPSLPDSAFCCAGCEAIHRTIHSLGLADFYRYRDIKRGAGLAASPACIDYSYLDALTPTGATWHEATLQIEGIHCAGCLWLLERLPVFLPGVLHSRLNFSSASLAVTFDPSRVKLSQVADRLDSLGYPVRLTEGRLTDSGISSEDRMLLIRIGVAAFCAMNTMMLAVSLWQGFWTGIDASYGSLFRYVSLILTLPAVTFSAWPFWATAFWAIRARTLHIDIPIALSLMGAFLISSFNTVHNREYVYFDSVTALITLLLTGRFLQSRALRAARVLSRKSWRLLPQSVKKVVGDTVTVTPVNTLGAGDVFLCSPGERVGVDGTVLRGTSLVDTSLLTGESFPRRVTPTDSIRAGDLAVDGELTIRASISGGASRVDAILHQIETHGGRSPLLTLTDRASGLFVAGILILSGGAATWWFFHTGIYAALDVFVATLIVTCPCALGLATPAALTVAVGRAAKEGLLIRGLDTIERVSRIKRVCFDKTGTLTSTSLSVYRFHMTRTNSYEEEEVLQSVFHLASVTPHHPVAAALCQFITQRAPETTSLRHQGRGECVYSPGRGVTLTTEDQEVLRLGSRSWMLSEGCSEAPDVTNEIEHIESNGDSAVVFSRNGRAVACFGVQAALHPNARSVVQCLSASGVEVLILSGDSQKVVTSVATQLGIPAKRAFGGLFPEEKARKIEQWGPGTLMVGDGFNDAYAMKVSDVGVGIRGAIDSLLEVVDVYVVRGGIEHIPRLIGGSRRTLRVIFRNLQVSALYNLLGATLSVTGYINPVWAAILMPISSLSVILVSVRASTFSHSSTPITGPHE